MKIPYGDCDFGRIRTDGYFYVDKTPFLPVLENLPRFLVFLRPRRFGKSTLLSLMEHYYDLKRRDRFDALFKGLWAHEHPTPEQGRYLVLRLDFSAVSADAGMDVLRRTFLECVRGGVALMALRYRERIPSMGRIYEELRSFQDPEGLLTALFAEVAGAGHEIYLLIDEYDHFANRLLASGERTLYDSVVKKTGFVRTFYAAVKAGAGIGAVARLFVTGVSPLMLDDLASGFNIATHVSLDSGLATLAGFTRAETDSAMEAFLTARPHLSSAPDLGDKQALMSLLEQFYNGYRFSPRSDERVFNSDMILYFLQRVDREGRLPANMLDMNVRTEYTHLQRLGELSGEALRGRRDLLETIGREGHVRSRLVERFGTSSLSSDAAFVSLLYYIGMLTLSAPGTPGGYDLEIPNRVIRELQWEHLAIFLREEMGITIGLEALTKALATMVEEGNIAPFLDLFLREVLQILSVRDTRGLDEKAIKLLLLVYSSIGYVFHPLSEKELAQGYGDLFLAANRAFPTAKYSWLLEVKYLKTDASPSQIEAAFAEAEEQVQRYSTDRTLLPLLVGSGELRAGMLVLTGAKKILFRPFGEGAPHQAALPRARATKAKPATPKSVRG